MQSTTYEKFRDLDQKTLSIRIDETKRRKIIADQRAFLTRHRYVSFLRRKRRKGRNISEKEQRRLIDSAFKSEQAFKNSIKSSLRIARGNKASLNQSRERILAHFDDFRIFSNPIFFDKKSCRTLTGLGLSMAEMRYYHNVLFNKRNAKGFKQAFETVDFYTLTGRAIENLDRIPFPESNKIMRQMGIITGGDDAIPYIVGSVSIIVGVIVTPVAPVIGIGLIAAGATTIAEEAYQDLSGTQDGEWNYGPVTVGETNFSMQQSDYPDSGGLSTPTADSSSYEGEYYGNRSHSKMEVHRVYCPWLHLIRFDHIHVYSSLVAAHSAGLDNCYYCVGGSKR